MIQKIADTQVPKYEVLDYIITPSCSEVNTEVLVDGSTVVEMTCMIRRRSYNSPRFFSSNDTNTDIPGWKEPGTWGLQFEDSGNTLSIKVLGNTILSDPVIRTNITYNDLSGNKYRYNLTAAGILNIYDTSDNVYKSYDVTQYTDLSYASSTPIKLFHRYASHEYINNATYVYDVKIWQNNELIRHYIPVKRLSDDVYGLYDLENETFHPNEISGYSFTGVSKATPEYIDGQQTGTLYVNDIIINNTHINRIYNKGTIYWGGDPLNLTQVDYIEPTGDWTDHVVPYPTTLLFSTVGVPLSWNTQTDDINIDCDITLLSDYCGYYSNPTLFGQHAMTGTTPLGGIARAIGLCYGTVNQRRLHLQYKYDDSYNEYALNDFVNAGRSNITISNGTCVITKRSDDTVIFTTTTTGRQSNYNLRKFYLFGAEVEQSQIPIVCNKYRLHYFKIYKNNNLIYDFEPVYNNITNEYGVHDKLRHQFYASESTTYPFTGPQIQ